MGYLAVRPQVLDDHLLLNRTGEPIREHGVRKPVAKYREKSGSPRTQAATVCGIPSQ
jgi:hypothetical protein